MTSIVLRFFCIPILIGLSVPFSIAQTDRTPIEPFLYTSAGLLVEQEWSPVVADRGMVTRDAVEPWDPSFYALGVTGNGTGLPRYGVVTSLILGDSGELFAAGGIRRAGGVPVNHIARWDGSEWHPLGVGVNGPIQAMMKLDSGELVVVGNFSEAGGLYANGVARWSDGEWHSMDPGFDGPKYAVVQSGNGDLYVAGGSVARWDGSEWTLLGQFEGANASVYGLAVAPYGGLYTVGPFWSVNGMSAGGMAYWDGYDWESISDPSSNGYGFDIILNDSVELIISGFFPTAAGRFTVMRRGSTWQPIGEGGLNNFASRMRVAPDGSLVAVGNGQVPNVTGTWSVARWDGHNWSDIGDGTNLSVSDVAFDEGNTVIGGNFSHLALAREHQQSFEGIARWDGSEWHPLDSRAPSLRLNGSVTGMAGGDGLFYVGGQFRTENGWSQFKRWNGDGWTILDYPFGESLSLRASGQDGDLYALGGTDPVSGEAIRVARWDGHQWHAMGAGLDDSGIYRIVPGVDGSVYLISGTTSPAGAVYPGQVWEWEGETWLPLGAPADHNVRAVARLADGRLVAAGDFAEIGGVAARRYAVWDGSTWSDFATENSNGAAALATAPNGDLYALGYFRMPDETFTTRVARWNSGEWEFLTEHGSGIGGEVMTFDEQGRLYTTASSAQGGIAVYDNGVWTRYATGVNGAISSIAITQDDLWAVGRFSQITHEVESAGVARLPRTAVSAEAGAPGTVSLASVSSFPNPFTGSTTIRFALPEAAPVTLTVYDLLGREVARLLDAQPHEAGEYDVVWQSEAASGIYLVRVASPNETVTHRITRLR